VEGPIGLSPGYGREFKRLSFPPQAEKTAERKRPLSGIEPSQEEIIP